MQTSLEQLMDQFVGSGTVEWIGIRPTKKYGVRAQLLLKLEKIERCSSIFSKTLTGTGMIGSSARITLIAVIIAIALIMGFKHITPEIPINEGVYLLAGLVGVVVALSIEWFISRRKKGRDK